MAIPCPLCESRNYKILYKNTLTSHDFNQNIINENLKNTLGNYKKHGQIVKCRNCNLIYVNPREKINVLLKGYQEVIDPEYIKTEKFRKILLKRHLNILEKFKKRGNVLDIGCFAGFFLELLNQKKWNKYGVEPSRWAKNIASKKNIKILGNQIELTNLKPNFFDVVTLWDVIEHLSDPKKVLKIIYNALKEDGIVAFATPNIDSFIAKLFGENYPYLIRMHLILYSPKTLRRILEENRFEVLYSKSYSRIYPLNYILERIKLNKTILNWLKMIIKTIPYLENFAVDINLRDEFIMLAKKQPIK